MWRGAARCPAECPSALQAVSATEQDLDQMLEAAMSAHMANSHPDREYTGLTSLRVGDQNPVDVLGQMTEEAGLTPPATERQRPIH